MTGACRECRAEGDLIEGVCIDCIFRMAEPSKQLSRDDLRRVREEVEKETAGLLPPALLRGILSRLLTGPQDALSLDRASNEIQRLAGLGMCRDMMRMAEGFRQMAGDVGRGLEETALSIEEEIRRKVRILSSLPGRP